jgi:two-component system, response regulator YesN
MDIRIKLATRLIDENLDKRFTLKEISEKIDLSTPYFSKLFKSEMKMSFKNYIIKKRMNTSKKLLIDTWLPIKSYNRKLWI